MLLLELKMQLNRLRHFISNVAVGSLQLGMLGTKATAQIQLSIFHEGTVSNWTITPLWTNTQESFKFLSILQSRFKRQFSLKIRLKSAERRSNELCVK
jgi:hypothetical protein